MARDPDAIPTHSIYMIPRSSMDAPQALSLVREPKANVERYDALRSKETARAS